MTGSPVTEIRIR